MSLPYMRLYPGDYLADTTHLSTEEHGAYLLLIMAYWQHGGPLPADDARLMRITRTNKRRWIAIKSSLFEFFDCNSENQLVHKRIQTELDAAADKCAKLQKAGRASGEKRANKCSTNDEHMLGECSSGNEQTLVYPNPDPESKNSLPPLTPHDDEQSPDEQQPDQPHMPSMEWQELREHYSRVARPEGPMDGYAEFCSAKGSRTMPSPSAMYDAIERWRQSGQWDGDSPCQFAPGLGKFISRRLWAAQPQTRVRQQRDGPQQPRATTVAQQRQQERDARSKNLLQRMGIGVQHGPSASGEVAGDRGCIDVDGNPVPTRGILGQ